MKTGIFRDELPGEKKSLINVVMTGYIVAISCMGYMAFYLFIQLSQVDRVVLAMNPQTMSLDQFNTLKDRLNGSVNQIRKEMVGLAIIGTIICVVGGVYSFNLLIRPLKKLVEFADSRGKTTLPEFKSNHELKQLATGLSQLTGQDRGDPSLN